MPRGGKRPGSGRPATVNGTKRIALRLSADEERTLNEIRGERSISDAVRLLIKQAQKHKSR